MLKLNGNLWLTNAAVVANSFTFYSQENRKTSDVCPVIYRLHIIYWRRNKQTTIRYASSRTDEHSFIRCQMSERRHPIFSKQNRYLFFMTKCIWLILREVKRLFNTYTSLSTDAGRWSQWSWPVFVVEKEQSMSSDDHPNMSSWTVSSLWSQMLNEKIYVFANNYVIIIICARQTDEQSKIYRTSIDPYTKSIFPIQ